MSTADQGQPSSTTAIEGVGEAEGIDPSYWTTPPASVDLLRSDPALRRIQGESIFGRSAPMEKLLSTRGETVQSSLRGAGHFNG